MLHTATCPTCGQTVGYIRVFSGAIEAVESELTTGRRAELGENGVLVATPSGDWARIVVGVGDVAGHRPHACGGRA